jgi:uncharacterized protein YndB with AHSA1/START domain
MEHDPDQTAGQKDLEAASSHEGSRHVLHGSFSLDRSIAAPPRRVFRAFSELSLRRRWFRIPSQPEPGHHELDFRVGGGEVASGTFAPAGIPEHIDYLSTFLDIQPDERIVLVNELLLDGRRRSISLVTVELSPDGDTGTQLTYTEQFTFLILTGDGGADIAEREGGTRLQLSSLIALVEHLADEV